MYHTPRAYNMEIVCQLVVASTVWPALKLVFIPSGQKEKLGEEQHNRCTLWSWILEEQPGL
jgi:hypothetical protein